MKKTMNLALTKPSTESVERLLNALNEFIDTLKHSKKTFTDNMNFCRDLRTKRKKFELEVTKTIKCFHNLPESKQVEVELVFFSALKKLQVIVPKAKQEIDDDRLFFLFSCLLKRELNKTLKFFKKSQTKMSAQLYSDPTEKIMSDPELQKELIDQWGELADEEY